MQKVHLILRNLQLGTRIFTDQIAGIFHLHPILISDVVRSTYREDSQLGLRLKSSLESGELVPDDLITELIEREIAALPGDFLLVDYPRTVNQCQELLELFRRKGMLLHKLWILELNDIEPLVISQQKSAETKGLYDKFAPESEDILRTRFQHANESIGLIKLAFKDEIPIEIIRYDHPLEDGMDEILTRLSNS